MEDRYNPQHIDMLPAEVRNSILHRCHEPKALHSFAGYFDDSKRIVCTLSISSVMETVLIAVRRDACTRFGLWCTATISWCEATTRQQAIELSLFACFVC
jgi:hypothetical protein